MKKRLLSLLLVLAMVFSLMPAALAADTVDVSALPEYTADADTSAGAAYKISTEEGLRAFAAAVKADDGKGTYNLSGVSFYLANDIALTGTWTPVGNAASYPGDFFAGTFDGCGHTISGLNVQGQGLFAAINQATIRNLNVSGTVNSTVNYVGGIVGKVQAGTIENCSFSGSVSSSKKSAYVGGIAGGLYSANVTISGCANTADVTGGYAGGILGYWRTAATIQNCYNTGSITGSDKAAGIVAHLNKGTIENCYSIGAVGGAAAQKGGIFGFSGAAVKSCYYTLPETESVTGTATAATQITSPEGLAGKLGNAFKEDTAGANNGYPILAWQAGEAVKPDPRIELTGPATLWRTNTEPQPQATLTAACKDMDKDTYVDWTLTEGEGIVTLETPEGAGAANQSVIVKALANASGKAVITASTANSVTASLTLYVIPQITIVEIDGTAAVGATVRAKVYVLGGGEYDYANFPALQIQWRYATESAGTRQDIAGATGLEYTIPENMAGNYLACRVNGIDTNRTVPIVSAEAAKLQADASALTIDTSDIRAATTIALPTTGAVNGSAITWTSSDSSIIDIIDPATGAVTLPASGIRTVTLSATLTRGDAAAHRNFYISVWSQAEVDKDAAKSELQKLVEQLDGNVTLTPEYGRDMNVNAMLSAKLDDGSIAVSVADVEEVSGGAGVAADGTITYYYVDPNTTPLMHCGSYCVTFALSKAGATETLKVPVIIGWDALRVRTTISNEITAKLTAEGLCAAGETPAMVTQNLTLPKVIDGKRWALISWTSSDPTVIAISDKNQQTADTLFDPYVGVIKAPAQDKTVTLTATVTFQLTGTQEQAITVSKVFTVTVKGQESTLREQLQAKLDAGFAAYGGLRDAVTGEVLEERDGKYIAANDIHFPTTGDFGVDGKYTPVIITSSDEDTIVPPGVNNAARVDVYRPLPGEDAKDVTVTVTIKDKETGIAVSRGFVIAVQPLTQQEIDAELALMAEVKAHYFDGIRNGNTDPEHITGNLHAFREVYLNADGQLVWVYDVDDQANHGIVPSELPGWQASERWRLFRSTNPAVISHENLLVTRATEHKAVTIVSELSSETLGKYAARYPDNADFQALSHQAVSARLIVRGTAPTSDEPQVTTSTVTFQLHTDTDMWIQPTIVYDQPEGTTAMDVFQQVLTANGYTYEAKGSYVQAITHPNGTRVAEFSKGQNSGWLFRVNGEFPDVAMSDYQLSDGDVIEVLFTANYMDEPGLFLPFTDVNNHWAYSAIKRVYNRGLMLGVSDTRFAPDQALSRAMLVTVLYRLADEPDVTADNPFTDVPAGQWYTNAVIWAAANGIVSGFGDGTFQPNAPATRAQAAVMLCGYAKLAGRDTTQHADLSAYADAAEIPSWALAEMQWANAAQLIRGRSDTILAPNAGTTRAEMAKILSTFIGK